MTHITNPLASAEQLYLRNSFGSLPNDLQDVVCYATQCLTQAAGILLQLPQSVTAQANVVLARYWLAESRLIMTSEFSDVSAACIFLVSKLGPRPRSARDISNVYAYLLSSNSSFFCNKGTEPPSHDSRSCYLSEAEYYAFHSRVLALEARILYSLSFDTHVALPHPLAITYLQALEFCNHQPREEISKRVLEYLNTALLSPQLLYLTHQPNMLAVAAIYTAAIDVGAKMPECEWWEVFDVEREELGFLVVAMRSLEGWVRKQKEEFAWLSHGMVTRRKVQTELKERGISDGNGAQGEDEEDVLMKQMGEKATQLEAQS
ncbi:cyclin-like protein [Coniella lustricola]|uniref:Cyclin-like protein n=1 Tax=Coniella lustricola TaxID=2025994 RepID=A0A2T3AKW1_9PEZI|nr:cyclin-like protein [Coniella lustricola]